MIFTEGIITMNKALLSSVRLRVGDPGLSGLAIWPVRAVVLAGSALLILALGETSIAKAGAPPAGRAYEMVSPPVKNGVDVGDSARLYNGESGMRMAPDGNSIIYQARGSFGGGASGAQFVSYRATRGADGWTTKPLLPPMKSGLSVQVMLGASTDLSRQVVSSSGGWSTGGFFTTPNDLLMVDATGSTTLMTPGQQPSGLTMPLFDGGSADLSRVVFTATTALTPNAPAGVDSGPSRARGNLYGWTSAGLRLLDVLPNGTIPSQGAALGADSTRGFLDHAISTDASRVFFTVPDNGSGSCLSSDPCARIYLRDDAFGSAARTVEVTSGDGGPDTPGSYPAVFRGASADGTRAFFTSPAQLTPDATTGASHGGTDLYEYRLGGGLTDLTVDHGDANGANVLGVMGMSDDGASVYFVATGQLDGTRGVAGKPNLYLHREGEPTRFIATLAENLDSGNWDRPQSSAALSSQVTPDGDHAVFASTEAGLHPQGSSLLTVYEYSVDTGLACVSCDPRGTAPTNGSYVPGLSSKFLGANSLGTYLPRSITDDGRVFFDSPDALVPEDTNGRYDVYMYENGALSLISTGRDPDDSEFIDTSANGADVFFITREQLSGDDVDTNMDLYDARIGGRTVPPRVVAPPCQNEDCRGAAPAAATAPTAATIMFSGAGNLAPPTVTTPRKTVKVTVTKKGGKGAGVALSVKVPTAGRLTARGSHLKLTKRSVGKAGTYRLKVALTAAGQRELKKHRRLAVRVRLTFAPQTGRAATTTVKLTVKA